MSVSYQEGAFKTGSPVAASGLEVLHNLTAMTKMSLRVDLRDKDESVFAKYSTFEVAKRNYKLTVGGYSGTAGGLKGFLLALRTHKTNLKKRPILILSPSFLWFKAIPSVTTTIASSPPKTATQRHSSPAVLCRTEEAGGTRTAIRQTSTAFMASTSITR